MANQQQTNAGLRELALFAGAGGGILGGKLLGWRTVCAVEWDAYAASVLVSRQNDGCLEAFPVWDDVQNFDGRPWKGLVDVVSGGFPCTDISCAGKGAGIDGKASSMWKHMARIIGEVRPRFVFVENSPMLTFRGLDRVLGDLSELGYDARWGVLGAIHSRLPHRRMRLWIVANPKDKPSQTKMVLQEGKIQRKFGGNLYDSQLRISDWQTHQPSMDRMDDGLADWVGRIRAIGNGQVPCVAALAWRILGGK